MGVLAATVCMVGGAVELIGAVVLGPRESLFEGTSQIEILAIFDAFAYTWHAHCLCLDWVSHVDLHSFLIFTLHILFDSE